MDGDKEGGMREVRWMVEWLWFGGGGWIVLDGGGWIGWGCVWMFGGCLLSKQDGWVGRVLYTIARAFNFWGPWLVFSFLLKTKRDLGR